MLHYQSAAASGVRPRAPVTASPLDAFMAILEASKHEVDQLQQRAERRGEALPSQLEGDFVRANVRYSVRVQQSMPCFGLYDNCDPARRCQGCEESCLAEKRIADLASPMRRTLPTAAKQLAAVEFVVEQGKPLGQGWFGAELLLKGRPHLGGMYSLIMLPPASILQLVSIDERTVITPAPDGLIIHAGAQRCRGVWQGRVQMGWWLGQAARRVVGSTPLSFEAAPSSARPKRGVPVTGSLGQ